MTESAAIQLALDLSAIYGDIHIVTVEPAYNGDPRPYRVHSLDEYELDYIADRSTRFYFCSDPLGLELLLTPMGG